MWFVVVLASLGFIAPQRAREQQEYCAFEVIVKSPRNEPVSGVAVDMIDEDGKEFDSVITDKNGIARLCDAPPGFVRLAVGGNRCGATTVSYLIRYWMETRRVTITYENCSRDEWVLPSGCKLTIRVRAEDGTPLAGVRLRESKERPQSWPQTSISDRWGRIFRFLKYGDHVTATFEKEGYLTQTVSAECKPAKPYDKDLTVTLEPVRRQ